MSTPPPPPTDSPLAEEGEPAPPKLSFFAFRAPQLPPPEPLDCILRSLLLAPLVVLGFALGSLALWSRRTEELYVFAGLVALMATPAGLVERWLYGSNRWAKLSSGCWLPLALGVVALFLIAQTVFLFEVAKGRAQEVALQEAFKTVARAPKAEAVAYLLPLTFPFAAALLLRWARVRRRWLLLLLPLASLPPAWLLVGLLTTGRGRESVAFSLIVLASSLALPFASAGAEGLGRRWRARRAD